MTEQTSTADSLKQDLRAQMKALRSALPARERKEADEAIRARVLESSAYRDATLIMPYLSFGAEVDTRGLIEAAWRDGKAVALPRCTGPRQMRWYLVESLDGLERSSFGVDEPREDPAREVPATGRPDALALVPGLSFDADGYRLGYGGGFYDAFLTAFKGVSIGLCRNVQMSPEPLPRGPFDLPVDVVVTNLSAVPA